LGKNLLGQSSTWAKVSLGNGLLGQCSPWAKGSWAKGAWAKGAWAKVAAPVAYDNWWNFQHEQV